MARQRMLHPDFFTDKKVLRCTPLARLLFQGLWCLADREGRVEGDPLELKIRILPIDACDVHDLLLELVDAQLIALYDAQGRPVIQVLGFTKRQKPHFREVPSILPPPPRPDPVAIPQKPGLSPNSIPVKPGIPHIESTKSPGFHTMKTTPMAKSRAESESESESESVVLPAPRKRDAAPKATDPRHTPLVKALKDYAPDKCFLSPKSSGWDAAAVKELLALGEPIEVLTRWRRALARDGFPTVRTLPELAKHWTHFATDSPPKPGAPINPLTQGHRTEGPITAEEVQL